MEKKLNKKQKTISLNFIINFCAVFSLVMIVSLLCLVNLNGKNSSASASLTQPVQEFCKNLPNSISDQNQTATTNPITAININVDDTGFLTKGISLTAQKNSAINIFNLGQNPHSFVIDQLGIDTGVIMPKESKIISINSSAIKQTSYTYYSNIGTENIDNFNGTITITNVNPVQN